jgi:hypothetical protein
MKHRLVQLLLAASFALVAVPSGRVEASPPSATAVVFESVDAVTMNNEEYMTIEGVVEGAAAASTIMFHVAATHQPSTSGTSVPGTTGIICHQQAMLALAHPGRYSLELDYAYANPPSYYTAKCTLRRR